MSIKVNSDKAASPFRFNRTTLGIAWLVAMTANAGAADERITEDAQRPSFEGIWLPKETGGPPPNGQANNPPPPGAPDGPGNSSLQIELSGTVLQCAPVQHLGVGGGGMSMLLIQNPQQIVLVSEFDMDIGRKIYINAQHPKHLVLQPNGHSVGHWEGSTLVVDTIGYLGKDGKDKGQHIIERFSRDGNLLTDHMSITDKDGKTRQQTFQYESRPDVQFNENVCEEGFDRYQVVNGTLDNPNIPPSRTR